MRTSLRLVFRDYLHLENKKKTGKSIARRKKERIQEQCVPENRVREGKHWKNTIEFGDN